MMKFSKFECDLYLYIAKTFGSKSDLFGHEYSDGFRSGHVLIGDRTDPVQAIFSFPNQTNDCYLIISDGDPVELSKEVASLQEYNDNTAHLCNGHTIPTNNNYLNEEGWVGYLITTPKVSYAEFPSDTCIDGRQIRIHLALPLTQKEREEKIAHGLDFLLDQFIRTERDTITFQQSHNKALQSDAAKPRR